jgi:hypothetical protein
MYNKTISKQLTEIMKLCYQINNVETNREKTGNLPTVFAQFYGHTCQLDVYIYDEGWTTPHDEEAWRIGVYLTEDNASTLLDKIIDRLNVTLKTKARKEKKQNV